MNNDPRPYMNPYIAGVFLGGVLLASFLILGVGVGASSALARIGSAIEGKIALTHTLSSEYFGKWGEKPLNYYMVYMFTGIILGSLFSSLSANRISFQLEKGKRASSFLRITFALAGGILIGYASRLAQGCTSGQALTGGALLLTGSIVFLICLFIGGYMAAYFVRRQWND